MAQGPDWLTHRTNLGEILHRIETADDEIARWEVQRDVLRWLQRHNPTIKNRILNLFRSEP